MKPAIRIILALLVAAWIAPVLAQQPLPAGDTILDKYIEVTGGKAAREKIHSTIATGTMEMGAMGIKGKLTIYQAEPALMMTEITLEGIGKIQEGSDGTVAWSLSTMQGPRLKEGEEKADAIREAQVHGDTNWRDFFKTAETVGVETVEGKACYKVVLTPKEGSPQTRYHDKETHLLLKTAHTVKGPMGEITAESLIGDYRKDGDILTPHKVTQKVAGQEITITIESVQYNVEIPKDKLALPDEIKALIAKGK